ncbi:MAG: T9SS type A sorting domain-containing protein [Saprospiraceae bacterium]|nr:T9SS type A sorting domain-containing protein [Saprospiraceae bacterium]
MTQDHTDPQNNLWERMADFPGEQRVAGTQFSLNGKGYVLSGEGADHYYLDEGEFWEYTPETDSWKQLPSWPGSGRWAPGCFVIGNTVYATGGTALLSSGSSENMKDLWAYEFQDVSGTTAPAFDALSVFPNPVTHRLSFSVPEGNSYTYRILDASGQVIRTGEVANQSMLVHDLSTGLYTLQLISSDNQYQARFLKA